MLDYFSNIAIPVIILFIVIVATITVITRYSN